MPSGWAAFSNWKRNSLSQHYSNGSAPIAPSATTCCVQVNRTLKRNKALDTGRVQGRIVAALDGIEVLSSYSRCCDSCLERRVSVRKAGVKTEQLQYYHRAVGCQIVKVSRHLPFLCWS